MKKQILLSIVVIGFTLNANRILSMKVDQPKKMSITQENYETFKRLDGWFKSFEPEARAFNNNLIKNMKAMTPESLPTLLDNWKYDPSRDYVITPTDKEMMKTIDQKTKKILEKIIRSHPYTTGISSSFLTFLFKLKDADYDRAISILLSKHKERIAYISVYSQLIKNVRPRSFYFDSETPTATELEIKAEMFACELRDKELFSSELFNIHLARLRDLKVKSGDTHS